MGRVRGWPAARGDDDGELRWERPAPAPRQLRRDVLLGLALAVAGVLTVELTRSAPGGAALTDRLLEGHLWAVAITVPLAVRRRFPITVMVACSALFFAMGVRIPALGISLVVQVVLIMAIYTAWAWSRQRRRLVGTTAAVVVGMFGWLGEMLLTTDIPDPPGGPLPAAVAAAGLALALNLAYFAGAIAWGEVSRRSARQRDQLRAAAEALRREQEANAARAVTDERLRIARDLHDVVAHHVSGLGIQAAAAAHVLDRDPAGSRAALRAIEESSRAAVGEMHQLVGLLRSDDNGDGPPARPGLPALPELVRTASTEQVQVRLRQVGDAVEVPDTVSLSLYRTAQEALANVRRHSSATEAEVVLRYLAAGPDTAAVEIEVLDDGPAVSRHAAAAAPAGGYGLAGIRERAALHGGHTELGPRPDGGFRVRVRVPLPRTEPGAGRPQARAARS